MDLHVRTDMVGVVPVVALAGTADLGTVPALQTALTRTVAAHPGVTVAVDLDGLIALDDTALGVLLGAAARARSGGGDIVVVTTDDRMLARLAQTGFDQAVHVRSRIAI
jgi:anti-anti-sigma factor